MCVGLPQGAGFLGRLRGESFLERVRLLVFLAFGRWSCREGFNKNFF